MSDQFNVNAPSESETEISLADIVQFIQESWKPLFGAGILGALLGLGGWSAFANYKAGLLLQNNDSFDIISWRSTEKILPVLASELLEKKMVPDNQAGLYKKMSRPTWWSENVQVNFALTKSDIKNLAVVNKKLDTFATTIISLEISASAPSEDKALNEVISVAQFIRNTASYIAIKKILKDYEIKSQYQYAEIQQKISATEIEIRYLQERSTHLAQLQKSYPNASNVTQQISQMVDSKDASSKFLPLTTQIIGVKNDIAANYESLKRLNDELRAVKTYEVFLDGAVPLMVGRYDGINMVKDLYAVEEKLRTKTPPGDIKALQTLDTIRAEFLDIEVSFRNRLQQNYAPIATKIGMLKSTAVGIFVAGFVMLAFLLGRKALRMKGFTTKS